MTKIRSLVFAWLSEDDWAQWRSIDQQLHREHKDWLAQSEGKLKQIEALGHRVDKVPIFPAEFLAWSRVNGARVDSNARAAFVGYKAARKHTDH